MLYPNKYQFDLGSECQNDAKVSVEVLERKAAQIEQKLVGINLDTPSQHSNYWTLRLNLADILIDLNEGLRAWDNAFPAFPFFIDRQQWEQAIVLCNTLFRSESADSLVALGHALWLSITFPVDPNLTVIQLQHVIDETPENSDGAAVAAAMAAYVVDLRGSNNNDDANLAVGQMLNDVARRHSNVQTQAGFDKWFEKLELDEPTKLVARMRNIIDVLVQDQWWVDRNALQALIQD